MRTITLRSDCIEAMAEVFYERVSFKPWADLRGPLKPVWRRDAEAALDALVDTLAEKANDWADLDWDNRATDDDATWWRDWTPQQVIWLLSVLRLPVEAP